MPARFGQRKASWLIESVYLILVQTLTAISIQIRHGIVVREERTGKRESFSRGKILNAQPQQAALFTASHHSG